MKTKSIYKHYQELLSKKANYFYNPDNNDTVDINDIFNSSKSKEFITQYFTNSGKGDAVSWLSEHNLFSIDDLRANHTVSAYFLGIVIRDGLNLNMSSLPRLEKKYRDNFMYFWSFSCLFHDAAYELENASDMYIGKCSSINDFLTYFDLKYSLLDYIDDNQFTNLVKNYYRYRISKNKIDHGITGAMFLFNGLMIVYEKAKKHGRIEKSSYIYMDLNYSFKFVEHIKHIASIIAYHNMWRADKKSIDDYKKFNLHDLIENGFGNTIVKLDSKSNLLFLLGMVDTIEPIKVLRNQGRNPYDIISCLFLEIDEQLILKFKGEDSDIEKLSKSIKEMEKWISVEIIQRNLSNEVGFRIKGDKNTITFKETEE